MKKENFEFDIALSFAGEDRMYVEKVAYMLRLKGIRVFYDVFEEVNLWGKNLYDYLSDIYQNKARYTILFISKFYNQKLWTSHERESMQARAFSESQEYILPARFDNTEIPGLLKTVGYINLEKRTPEDFAALIEKKLIVNGGTIPSRAWRYFRSTFTSVSRSKPYDLIVKVYDQSDGEVSDVCLILMASNGTYLEGKTNAHGEARFLIKTRRLYTVLITHPNFSSRIVKKFDPCIDLEVRIESLNAVGSMILHKSASVPGLKGKIKPLINSKGKKLLYTDNIAINDGYHQPFNFEMNKPLTLEDKEGNVVGVIIKFIKGNIAIIDYTNHSGS